MADCLFCVFMASLFDEVFERSNFSKCFLSVMTWQGSPLVSSSMCRWRGALGVLRWRKASSPFALAAFSMALEFLEIR